MPNKQGTSGTPCSLVSNVFPITCAKDWVLYQYHVDFNPDIENKQTRLGMVYRHSRPNGALGDPILFDGMCLYMTRKMETFDLFSQRDSDGANIRITIKPVAELRRSTGVLEVDGQLMTVFNNLFKKVLGILKLTKVGQHYFNPDLKIEKANHRLEIWPGFQTAIRSFDGGIMLQCDIAHKIMRIDSVLDIMYELNQRGGNIQEACARMIIGGIVLTRYNNKTYTIDDIEWNENPSSTFPKKDGTAVTYNEYYKTTHDCTIHDAKQPLLISNATKKDRRAGRTEPYKLIPELCIMTGLSEDARSNFQLMRDVAETTRVRPDARAQRLEAFLTQINSHPEVTTMMQQWGLSFSERLQPITSRVLVAETVQMRRGNGNELVNLKYQAEVADWGGDLKDKKMVGSIALRSWVMVATKRDSEKAQNAVQMLRRVGGPLGMAVEQPRMVYLTDDRTNTFLQAIRQELRPDLQLVMALCPNNRKDRYDAIKKLLCLDNAVPSQVILTKTLAKNVMSVMTKVAMQINCKLGGSVWGVPIPLKSVMFIGFDTYHDSSQKNRSVGAFVASLTHDCTRYTSSVMFQHNHQELVDGLQTSITAALRAYNSHNGGLPDRIMVFRDGVGEGQLPVVREHEVKQFMRCFKQFGDDYNPKFTFTVVTKRVNARFMRKDKRRGNLENPAPGTVIDTVVTNINRWDFYLVCQSVRQGSVTPTAFNILHDTSGLASEHHQRLAYKLAHLYYNWPGTIRVPAPCQYAHKLAFLVGQSLHRDPHLALADKLYYL
ncbi:PREDICTED: piwi-like protein 1 isoform X2 [Priapulus caudatus]|uniref:Piwi-like protein 1 isoform X2 n=1 Tax=Priapulus caudatus TaxID=37621 RepID=A0ABM1EKZ4_PRICU|nr:PREDICTED: piwi-like protein 1 isoform X2 [Priapulus caudatus]